MGTFAFSDLYGPNPPGTKPGTAAAGQSVKASGAPPTDSKAPASIWVGMVLSLVLLRLAWEYAK